MSECTCGGKIPFEYQCRYCLLEERKNEVRRSSIVNKQIDELEEKLLEIENNIDEIDGILDYWKNRTEEEREKELTEKFGPGWRSLF